MGLSIIPGEDVQHEFGRREGETPVEQGLENYELPRLGLRQHVVRLGEPVPAIGSKLPVLDQLIDVILADLRREPSAFWQAFLLLLLLLRGLGAICSALLRHFVFNGDGSFTITIAAARHLGISTVILLLDPL